MCLENYKFKIIGESFLGSSTEGATKGKVFFEEPFYEAPASKEKELKLIFHTIFGRNKKNLKNLMIF